MPLCPVVLDQKASTCFLFSETKTTVLCSGQYQGQAEPKVIHLSTNKSTKESNILYAHPWRRTPGPRALD